MDYRRSGKQKTKLGLPSGRNPLTAQLSTYSDDEAEFLRAIDKAKKDGRVALTWPEVLAIAKELGYRKTT